MRTTVIGTGYVGLVTGTSLAYFGHPVTCVDTNPSIVERLSNRELTIYENGLEEIFNKAVDSRNLSFTTKLDEALVGADLVIIAVGTPFDGKRIDLKYIKQVAKEIGEWLKANDQFLVVTIKSTVIPGTTSKTAKIIIEEVSGKKEGVDFCMAMNPEFLREGCAVKDFMEPDRIVLGCSHEYGLKRLHEIYENFNCPKIEATPTTAEMIKYTANSLFANMISFSNEISNICEEIGSVDVEEVFQGVYFDKRLMPRTEGQERIKPELLTYLKAGCGFGGSCFPKDVKALASFAEDSGLDSPMLRSVLSINSMRHQRVVKVVNDKLGGLNGKTITILGLAFKPETDDIRESASIRIIRELLNADVDIKAYDPIVKPSNLTHQGADDVVNKINICTTKEEAMRNSDAILILTAWDKFLQINNEQLNSLDKKPFLFDGRRILKRESFTDGQYLGIGFKS